MSDPLVCDDEDPLLGSGFLIFVGQKTRRLPSKLWFKEGIR